MAQQKNPPRAQRKDAVRNRAAILDAAAALLPHDPDASIEAIAAQAGLTRRAVYGHFASREELIDELLLRAAAELNAAVEPAYHSDPRVALAMHGARLWSEIETVRLLALLSVHAQHGDQVARMLEPVRYRLRTAVERGIAAGVLRDDVEAGSLTRLIEASAMAVLDEAQRTFLSAERGHRLVVLAVLGIAGLGWQEAGALLDSTPVLAFGATSAPRHSDPAWLRA